MELTFYLLGAFLFLWIVDKVVEKKW